MIAETMTSNADLTAEKQAWLLNAVKSGKLTFGQGIDEINKILLRMDVSAGNSGSMPQLSNDEQIRLLNAVKNRELTIDEAWEVAQSGKPALQEPSKPDTMPENTQYNFSVYKHNRYRRQKRVLMIDYNSRLLCNIEKGIIKKQFSFKSIKSCEHVEGQKISISFLRHHDYELEATSAEDRIKIIQLVNQIIQNNINATHPTRERDSFTPQQETEVIKEGQLELQKGGLASVKWNRYCVQLHKGELSFQRLNLGDANEQLGLTPNVIYLSDGNASVHKEVGSGSFTVITKKNCYLFRIPVTDQLQSTEDLTKCRDEWIDAIDKCCLHWKRLSQSQTQLLIENNLIEVIPDIPSTKEPPYQTVLKQPNLSATSNLEGEKEQKEDAEKEAEEEGMELTSAVKKTAVELPLEKATLSLVTQCLPGPTVPVPPLPALAIPVPPQLLLKKSSGMIKKTKAFHWDVVAPEKIQKSIWGQSNTAKIQLHYPRLLEQFSTQDILTHPVNDFSTHQQILLNHKVAHNFNIFLKSFPIKVSELRGKLLIIQEENGGLSNEHIASLRRYVPTPNDIEKYKTYKGSQADLHVVDQYMMEMCNIPHLSDRLDLILSIREFPETVDDLQPLIRQKIKACSQLLESKLFVSVLEYLLAIGNFLNTNAGKEKAKGFYLSSLTKVVQLRGKDRKFTLLHALVEQITSQEPALTNFPQELTEFEDVPGDSIKGLIAEVDVLKNDLMKIIQYGKLFKPKNKMYSDGQFYKGLKVIIQKYEAELSDLTKQRDEMKKLYSSILVKFGEPQDRDSQELFGWISSFIKDFRRAVTERRSYKLETTQK
ncbi:protein diaphanous homolog 2 [Carcharodon carcharias]|uniref:protein diaphanous homolog 2 n=1 Tax=Carcharodon carcharias TaxID=13397 RepID=UPI001B7EF70C|nr:protein diaphanous homolog 2 [Carcharodon carcharias]